MTKEELERIKQAYNSGLKVQIWFNGYWEDFDVRDYSMYPEPFSENRQYRVVGNAYADIAEKHITELEKENAELRRNEFNARSCLELQQSQDRAILNYMGEQLTKAKEIIKTLLLIADNKVSQMEFQIYVADAKQFLNSEVEK